MILRLFVAIFMTAYMTCCLGYYNQLLAEGRQPFGLRMCQHLCRRLGGCSDIRYSHSRLNCQLLILDNAENDLGTKRETEEDRSCIRNWMMIESRKKENLCVKIVVNFLADAIQDRLTLGRKLLVIPKQGKPDYITQIDLNNYQTSWFPYFHSHLRSVLYLASSRQFIISRYAIGKVISFEPASNSTTLLFKHTAILFMVKDEKRKLVFYVTWLAHCLGSFSTNGSGRRILAKLPSHASSAALNEDKQQIYVSFTRKKKIMSINYEGKVLNILRESVCSNFLSYDVTTNLLYFNDGFQVLTFDTINTKVTKVIKSDLVIKSGVVLGTKLYLSSCTVKEVHVVDLQTKNVTAINLKYKKFHFFTLLMF